MFSDLAVSIFGIIDRGRQTYRPSARSPPRRYRCNETKFAILQCSHRPTATTSSAVLTQLCHTVCPVKTTSVA